MENQSLVRDAKKRKLIKMSNNICGIRAEEAEMAERRKLKR